MKYIAYLACAIVAGAVLPGGSALAANMCRADGGLTCATTMPIGGYCECTARGNTQSGTVEAAPARGRGINSTAGGCGSQPNAPGCR